MEVMNCLQCGRVFMSASGPILCRCCKESNAAEKMLHTLEIISAEWHKGNYGPEWLLEHTKIDQVIEAARAALAAAERITK